MNRIFGKSPLWAAFGEWLYLRKLERAFHLAGETEVAEPVAPAAPSEKSKEDEQKSALDEARDQAEPKDAHGGSKPPEDGRCRECRRLRRLNRLRLCYPCYVELNIADGMKKRGQEWKPGDKHPAWCDCEGLGEHPERDNGAWKGN